MSPSAQDEQAASPVVEAVSEADTDPRPAERPGPLRGRDKKWVRAATETRWLVLLALLVRGLAAWSNPAVVKDSVSLLRGARDVLDVGAESVFELSHHPLPPLLIGWCSRFMDVELAATTLTVVGSALAVWPLHALARRACGRHAAAAACILYAALPKFVEVGSVPLTEGFFLPLFLGALALLVAAPDSSRKETRRLLAAGLWGGMAYLCRPEALLLLPAGIALLVLVPGRRLRRPPLFATPYVVIFAAYVALLSLHRGTLTLSPKKDLARFAGQSAVGLTGPAPVVEVAAPSAPSWLDALYGAGGALESALMLPVLVLVVLGVFPWKRWQLRHARPARLLLLFTATASLALVVRLHVGWGYGGGRHAIAAAVLLLPFAGHGLSVFGAILPRVSSRRRFALYTSLLLAIALGSRSVLRPAGESGVAARALGVEIALTSPDGSTLQIATVAEPRIAYYADRELRRRGGTADDVPLWGRYVRPVTLGADLPTVTAVLASELRQNNVDWIALDLFREDRVLESNTPLQRSLAATLQEREFIAQEALSSGVSLAAFRVTQEE